jgi:hypothetical protein
MADRAGKGDNGREPSENKGGLETPNEVPYLYRAEHAEYE